MRYLTIGAGPRRVSVSELCLGTMHFGTRTDERTAYAILDRFLDAGGTFLDTANCYNVWLGGHGRESEQVLGRWLASRRATDRMVVASKVGARPRVAGELGEDGFQGLAPEVIKAEAAESVRTLGVERLGILYAHYDDRRTPQAETVAGFGEAQASGLAAVIGASNHATWRIESGRALARQAGVAGYECAQQKHSYLYPLPGRRRADLATPELLDYAADQPGFTVLAYSPLRAGGYADHDRLTDEYLHPGARHRLAVLDRVAAELGATPNQVVLAWLLGGETPVIPVFGVSSVAQLDEVLAAVDLTLPEDARADLDGA